MGLIRLVFSFSPFVTPYVCICRFGEDVLLSVVGLLYCTYFSYSFGLVVGVYLGFGSIRDRDSDYTGREEEGRAESKGILRFFLV